MPGFKAKKLMHGLPATHLSLVNLLKYPFRPCWLHGDQKSPNKSPVLPSVKAEHSTHHQRSHQITPHCVCKSKMRLEYGSVRFRKQGTKLQRTTGLSDCYWWIIGRDPQPPAQVQAGLIWNRVWEHVGKTNVTTAPTGSHNECQKVEIPSTILQ